MDDAELPPYPALLPLHYRIMTLVLLVWWIAFLYPVLAPTDIDQGLLDAEAATAQGNLYNQVLIFSFAGLGLIHGRRALLVFHSRAAGAVVLLAGLYCLWSATTLLWSEDPSLTLRRLFALVLVLAGSFGLGAGFYANAPEGIRTLAKHVVFAAVVCVVTLIGFRLWDSTLAELLDPEFSLKGSTRISYYAFPIGYAIAAVLVLFQGQAAKQLASASVLFSMMVILKGRTMCADALATALLVSSRISTIGPVRAVCLFAGTALTALLADLVTGGKIFIELLMDAYGTIGTWIPWLTLGEGLRNITSLSGRLPLWEMLYPYIQSSPWGGRGFGAFWNPTRFVEAYKAAGWRAVTAHNGFLDELLATGIIGLGLFLSFWLTGMVAACLVGHRRQAPYGYLVAGWLLLFLLFNSLESIFQMFFQMPTYVSLIALFALLQQDTATAVEENEGLHFTIENAYGEPVA